MKKINLIIYSLFFNILLTSCADDCFDLTSTANCSEQQAKISDEQKKNFRLLQFTDIEEGEPIVLLKTNMGNIKIRLFPKQAPKACENFLSLARNHYYDKIIFHRVIKDFIIQSGDPTGTGQGGTSKWNALFEDEFSPMLRNFYGAVCMANYGTSDTNGSQFFIVQTNTVNEEQLLSCYTSTVKQASDKNETTYNDIIKQIVTKYMEIGGAPHLDDHHTVFGHVIEGLDVVYKIANSQTNLSDKPISDITIDSVEISKYKTGN